MSVQIVLDGQGDQRQPYQAGSQIGGKVKIRLRSGSFSLQDAIPEVVLWFSCSSNIQFEYEAWFMNRDRITKLSPTTAILFKHKHVLRERTFLPPQSGRGEDGATLVFPFQVTLPAFEEPISNQAQDTPSRAGIPLSLNDTDIFLPDDPWPGSMTFFLRSGATAQAQRLPDSSARSFFYESSNAAIRFEGSIEYVLRVEKPDAKVIKVMEEPFVEEKLTVVNQLSDLISTEANRWVSRQYEAQVRTPISTPGKSGRRGSIRERAASIFKKDSAPTTELHLKFESKEVLLLDARDDVFLPFRLSIMWQQHSSGSAETEERPELPPVYLTRLRVSLNGHVAARTNAAQATRGCPRSVDGHDKWELFDWKESSKSRSRNELPVDSSWDIGSNLGTTYAMLKGKASVQGRLHPKQTPMALVPDFRIPNLVRNYSLAWELVVECAGQEVKWKCGVEDDVGLPVKLERGAAIADVVDQLPAYDSLE